MFLAGEAMEEIIDADQSENEPERQARAFRLLRSELSDLSRLYDWEELRQDPLTKDFAAATDDTGLYMPSSLGGISLVIDADAEMEIAPRSRADAATNEQGYRYYLYRPSATALYDGDDMVLANGGATFASDALTAAGTTVTDQYMRIGYQQMYYLISNTVTPFAITPTYRGTSIQSDGVFSIRPSETKKINMVDTAEEEVRDRDVKVYWWSVHPPVFRNEDPIFLPSRDLVVKRVIAKLPNAKRRRPIGQNALDDALQQALSMNPPFEYPYGVRGRNGQRIDFNAEFYASRDDERNGESLLRDVYS